MTSAPGCRRRASSMPVAEPRMGDAMKHCRIALAAIVIGALLLACTSLPTTPQNNEAEIVSAVAPYALRAEYAVNPLGLDTAQPRLAWKLPAHLGGGRQSAYRIRVAASASEFDSAALWDSGKQ